MVEWNKQVKLIRLLNDDQDMKFASVEGEVTDKDGVKQPAVLLFEKTPFRFDDVAKLMQENEEQFKVEFINDIYHKYSVEARMHCNGRWSDRSARSCEGSRFF